MVTNHEGQEVAFSEIAARFEKGETIRYTGATIVLDSGGQAVFGEKLDDPGYTHYTLDLRTMKPDQDVILLGCRVDGSDIERLGLETDYGSSQLASAQYPFSFVSGKSDEHKCDLEGDELSASFAESSWCRVRFADIRGHVSNHQYFEFPKENTGYSFVFEYCSFRDELWFGEVAHRGLLIEHCTLSRQFRLDCTTFGLGFALRNSKCVAEVVFENSIVVDADFESTTFESPVVFGGVEFRGGVGFQRCRFVSGVSFGETSPDSLEIDGQRNDYRHARIATRLDFDDRLDLSHSVIAGGCDLPVSHWGESAWLVRAIDWMDEYERGLVDVTATAVDGCTNMLFRRWVQDRNYLAQFKERHRVLYWAWLVFADCGRSFSLWLAWSVILATGFGIAFRYMVKQFIVNGVQTTVSLFDAMYFSIITFTTLGLGDVLPVDWVGKVWVAAEVVVGYLMLGGLISIFADKLARRS